jgi:multidrug efflux system membrane fusion protein
MDDTTPKESVARLREAPSVPVRPGRVWRRRVGWAVAALVVLAALTWTLWPQPPAPQRGGRFRLTGAMPVVAATVAKADVPVTLSGLGTVTPLAVVTIRPQISGYLVALGFKEGQMVKQGDFLAQIDPRPYQIALDQAQAQLARDQAQLDNGQIDLARYRRLAAQDSIARQQLDTQQALVHQLEATVATDKAQIDQAKLNLEYCHIVSPIEGRVGLRQVDVGNYVQTGDTNGIVVVAQLHPISVIFTLPEDDVPQIMKRLREGATLPVAAYDRTNTTKLATGALSTVDNQIDTSTGTVRLRADFDNADNTLFPNQFVNVTLLTDTLAGATVVPSSAIQRGAPGTFVYVVKPDHTVAVQPVKLGPTAGDQVAITSGLEVGAQIVVDGADKLRDGAKVLLPGEDGGTARAAGGRGPGQRPQGGATGPGQRPQNGGPAGQGQRPQNGGPAGQGQRRSNP